MTACMTHSKWQFETSVSTIGTSSAFFRRW